MTDVLLKWLGAEADLQIAANDLQPTDRLESAVAIALFTDKRAPADAALPSGSDRGGWWGDTFPFAEGDEDGSLLWLLSRQKQTQGVLEDARRYCQTALQHLVTDGAASAVRVAADYPARGMLRIQIEIDETQGGTVYISYLVRADGTVSAEADDEEPLQEIKGANNNPALTDPAYSTPPPGALGRVQGSNNNPALSDPAYVTPGPGTYGRVQGSNNNPANADAAFTTPPQGKLGTVQGANNNPAVSAPAYVTPPQGTYGQVLCGCADMSYLLGALYTGDGQSSGRDVTIPDANLDESLLWVIPRFAGVMYQRAVDAGQGKYWANASQLNDAATALAGVDQDTFEVGTNVGLNTNAAEYAALAFRKLAGFSDIVWYTGNGANRTIAHNLGVVPKVILLKPNSAGDTLGSSAFASYSIVGSFWSNAEAFNGGSGYFQNTPPDAAQFTLGSNGSVNANGTRYAAWLLGGDNVAVGQYEGNGNANGPTVVCGWQPRFVLIHKNEFTTVGERLWWALFDQFRNPGFTGAEEMAMIPSNVADVTADKIELTDNGFHLLATDTEINKANVDYFYIAIR